MNLLSFICLPKSHLLTRTGIPSYFTLFMCLLLPSQVFAVEDVGIEVTGQGSVVVIPDQFSLTLTITERGRVPSKLKTLVDKKSNSVVNAAKSLAIKESNISSARVNLRATFTNSSVRFR